MRVAACTPWVGTADPAFNHDQHVELARKGDADAVDLMVFPELSLSAYAIDDLHLQDALLERHGIVVPIWRIGPNEQRIVRISAQAYNTVQHYERLAHALREELAREHAGQQAGAAA